MINMGTPIKTPPFIPSKAHNLPPQQVSKADTLIFTYDVRWEYSDVKWASRSDV